jgi:hypothetical protein
MNTHCLTLTIYSDIGTRTVRHSPYMTFYEHALSDTHDVWRYVQGNILNHDHVLIYFII